MNIERRREISGLFCLSLAANLKLEPIENGDHEEWLSRFQDIDASEDLALDFPKEEVMAFKGYFFSKSAELPEGLSRESYDKISDEWLVLILVLRGNVTLSPQGVRRRAKRIETLGVPFDEACDFVGEQLTRMARNLIEGEKLRGSL